MVTESQPMPAGIPPGSDKPGMMRMLIGLALPILLGSVVQSANTSINSIWVGRLLGAEALAATTNANTVLLLLNSLVLGFALSSSVVVGQLFGRGDTTGLRRVVGTSLVIVALLGVLIMVICWLSMSLILDLLATPPAVEPLARGYFSVLMLALPAVFFFSVLSNFLRTIGAAVLTLWALLLCAVLDIVINPFLIAGLHGFPKLGIIGSALASVIATYLSLAITVVLVYRRDLVVRLRGSEWGYLRPQLAIWLPVMARGFVVGLQIVVMSASAIVLLSLINREGVAAIAGYGVMQQIWTYMQMPAVAVGLAASVLASRLIGEGRQDSLDRLASTAIFANLILTTAIYLLVVVIGPSLPALFLGHSSPSVPIASHINLVAGWSMISFGVTFVLFGIVRANGVVLVPLVILFAALLPVRLGFAVYFHHRLGADSIWYSIPVGACVAMLLAIAHYVSRNWQRSAILLGTGASDRPEHRNEAVAKQGGKP
jgi:putative MATE family efflux protein